MSARWYFPRSLTQPRLSLVGSLTSEDLASVLDAAERRWFEGRLRARIDDSERFKWKSRFVARAVVLLARWRGKRP